MKTLKPLIILLLLFLWSPIAFTQSHKLTLVFDNIEAIQGELSIGIFSNEETFLDEGNEFKKLILKVDGKSVRHQVTLPEGDYAVSVYHDKNADKQCNRNFIGVPTEGYGFSNNVKPRLSAPKFQQCKFTLSNDVKHHIEMQN